MAKFPPPNQSQGSWSPSEMMEQEAPKNNNLIERWYALTAIPEAPVTASFTAREASRKSRLTSSVLFFFTVMVISLLPACFLAISLYPSYFWLTLGLAGACIVALMLNRGGHTLTAGILVNIASFSALTAALFSTIPFDETTLQGYDMYVVVELLAVSLLPARSVILVYLASVASILGTLFGGVVQHSTVLQNDLNNRWFIMIARPIGTLLLVGGVAFILATTLSAAIKRANQAEMIAKLEHELSGQRQELEAGIQQLLDVHVQVANGNLSARASLSQNNVLWQIASALNNLLVRFQRASQTERDLQHLETVIDQAVATIQQADAYQQKPVLRPTRTPLDRFIAVLPGRDISLAPAPMDNNPTSFNQKR
ncbi:hypothetical protein KSC_109980 [Ktedonobacter sp. SOSP1-52]|uniref:hypothetical protein n=1 Tax=Ktedonobacter sp. SOSP1-52 TaxID=2778366 RepID=UPI0019154FA9|nr:hypothetical protein [Ktedonobacter sp. SOSP1-52]GHO72106.1 hypothetical protein KSC_109980 [Ktedonobacter sp. SOSP1-52]